MAALLVTCLHACRSALTHPVHGYAVGALLHACRCSTDAIDAWVQLLLQETVSPRRSPRRSPTQKKAALTTDHHHGEPQGQVHNSNKQRSPESSTMVSPRASSTMLKSNAHHRRTVILSPRANYA